MTRLSHAFAAVVGLAWASAAWADAPQIGGISPFGARRGAETDVTIAGTSLAGRPRLVAPFGFRVGPPKSPSADASKWTFALTVDSETPVGVYVVRVQTEGGLSNPFLFAVGQVEQVAEREDNSQFDAAQPIPSLCVVEGQVAGSDVDYFRFKGKKGQHIVVDAQCARIGSGVDPTVRLTTATHKYVASADDSAGLLTDARLTAVLPEDCDYVIELSDTRYQGGGRPIYRLLVGALPVADEIYPLGGRRGEAVGFELRGGTLGRDRLGVARLDGPRSTEMVHARFPAAMLGIDAPGLDLDSVPTLALDDFPELREPADPKAPPLRATPPVVLNGRIESKGDEDSFILAVTPGQRLRFDVSAADLGSALDGVLNIKRPDGGVLATADDTTAPAQGKMKNKKAPAVVSPDPAIDFTVPGGLTEIVVSLRDLKGDGGVGFPYRLTVDPIVAGFDVALNDAQATIPKGGSAAIAVTVARKGYNGPITLDVARPPPGLTVRPGSIAEGQAAGAFTVTAAPDATFDRVELEVVGRAPGLEVLASKLLVFAVQGAMPSNVQTQLGLPAASALPEAVAFEVPAAPVEIAHGYGGPVPIKLTRTKGADAALTLEILAPVAGQPPSPGITAPAGSIPEKAATGSATINTAVDAPLGPLTLVLFAKGKLNGADRTMFLPAVTVNVVRPASVEPAAPSAEFKAGTTVEVKGKVVRKGPFKEPITVKLEGLPAGLKADPVIVAPDKAEFVLKVIADAKAPAAATNARLVLAFQVNKKDYPTPPTPLAVKVVAGK
jgi:hypothetical protein